MDKEKLYIAYNNWVSFLEKLDENGKKIIEEFIEPIESNNLHYYYVSRNFHKFDLSLNRLSNKYLFDEEIISTVYRCYLERDLHEVGFDYILKAEKYYKENCLEVPLILQELREQYPDEKTITSLKLSLGNLASQRATDIPRIMPSSINGYPNLNTFILKELIQASKIMMEKIESIRDVKDENRYNDLIFAILNLRLAIWGWSIVDQARVGTAPGGKDAGEADHLIKASGNTIALFEAFILRDKKQTEKHILKCKKYISNIERYYIIIYNKDNNDLMECWESYQNYVLNISYPSDFVLNNAVGFEDLSKTFIDTNNIRIGKTSFNENVEIFHIMINLV